MEAKDLIGLINIEKGKAVILADLVDGDLLDKLYAAIKPTLLKAIKEALG